jgi:predicted O-methyltransferase YrrM
MALRQLLNALAYPYKSSALRYVLRQPSLLLALTRRGTDGYFPRAVRGLLGEDVLAASRHALPEEFRRHVEEHGDNDHQGWRMVLYLLIRRYRPKVVVETGVSRGASSAYILAAMRENGVGHLHSIDLPPTQAASEHSSADGGVYHLPDGQQFADRHAIVADFIPEFLRDRWTLIQGDAAKELPPLLARLGSIDVFFHDSLHTYEHMKFEFEAAWPCLAPGGWMLSHDVVWNRAWAEFTRRVGARPYVYHSFSMFRKPAPSRP